MEIQRDIKHLQNIELCLIEQPNGYRTTLVESVSSSTSNIEHIKLNHKKAELLIEVEQFNT